MWDFLGPDNAVHLDLSNGYMTVCLIITHYTEYLTYVALKKK